MFVRSVLVAHIVAAIALAYPAAAGAGNTLNTFGGTGSAVFSGDTGLAVKAGLSRPRRPAPMAARGDDFTPAHRHPKPQNHTESARSLPAGSSRPLQEPAQLGH